MPKKPTTPRKIKHILQSIEAVVDYAYEDEHKHWEEEGKPKQHIFLDIDALEAFLVDVENGLFKIVEVDIN